MCFFALSLLRLLLHRLWFFEQSLVETKDDELEGLNATLERRDEQIGALEQEAQV